MSKIVEIYECEECPHCDQPQISMCCTHKDVGRKSIIQRPLDDCIFHYFPEWCPLEDLLEGVN